jgi:hypothetical protein
MPYLARLKPLNERKGYKVRVYMFEGARFMVERGWYEVPDDLAVKLRLLHQEHYDLDSPMLFDVCTPEEAERLEESERRVAHTERATVSRPASVQRATTTTTESSGGDLTSADLKQPATMIDPADEDDEVEDEGRVTEVGKVTRPSAAPHHSGPKTRTKK